MSLREFCKIAEVDPSNWSKVERGLLPAPNDRDFLEKIAKILKLKKASPEWFLFYDLAAISQQRIPDDVYPVNGVYEDEPRLRGENAISALPVFFRTIRGEKPTEEEMEKLITLIKRR